jgi:hypothetical protein
LRQKKQNVRIAMFGACALDWSPPNQSSTLPDRKIIKNPMRYCDGISHDFLRPNRAENNESTTGAHRSFTLNGQWTKLNCAWKKIVLLKYFNMMSWKMDINRNKKLLEDDLDYWLTVQGQQNQKILNKARNLGKGHNFCEICYLLWPDAGNLSKFKQRETIYC